MDTPRISPTPPTPAHRDWLLLVLFSLAAGLTLVHIVVGVLVFMAP